MKLSVITLITILLSGIVSAQTTDSTAAAPQRGNGKQQRMDRFIDLDGDGICDHRSQGIGFRRNGNPLHMKKLSNSPSDGIQSMGKGNQHRGAKK
jgi:hypothetical protein